MTILITGATGLIGRALVERLRDASDESLRTVSRRPAAPESTIEVFEGDPSRPDTVHEALDGVRAVFVNPRAVGERAEDFLAAARSRGVQKVVVLAASNVEDSDHRQPSRFLGDRNRETEQAVVTSGLPWVSLRSSIFAVNTAGWTAQLQRTGIVRGPYAAARWTVIDETDLAAVAALALTSTIYDGSRLVLTGPAALSQGELVATIGAVLGRQLIYQEIPPEAARPALAARGGDEFAAAFLAMQAELSRNPPDTTSTVADVLGRPARTYAQWVGAHCAAFAPTN